MVKKILNPIEKFMHLEASSGIMLIIATLMALIMVNTGMQTLYYNILHFPINLDIGSLVLHGSVHHWVNDALMVIFFFIVGLEIKREMVSGELSSPQKAALPIFAAFGGMVVPALFYVLLNMSEEQGTALNGWGIPMATDIAFAVGVVALLGKRVPFSLKIFLLALAIVDDLGAVFVIAAFYTEQISAPALGIAGLGCLAILLFRYIGVRSIFVYILLGLIIWLGFFTSGIHATIAGVIIGFLTPSKPLFTSDELGKKINTLSQKTLSTLNHFKNNMEATYLKEKDRKKIFELRNIAFEGLSPIDRIIDIMHPWVSFFIMPAFAFCNAGVVISSKAAESFFSSPISLGIFLGLVVGKPVGILIFSALSVVFKLAALPKNVTWTHIIGLGFLGGIGFTMSLFVTSLAISDPLSSDLAKMGILTASLAASFFGAGTLILASKK